MSETRMLIAYDGSEDAGGAISAAARLLPTADATIVHVRDAAMSHDVAAAIAERGRAIAAAAGLQASALIRVARSARHGICDAAAELSAEVVVCGARGHRWLSHAHLGSTSSSLLHHASCPVLVVPSGERDLTGPIVIGFDASDGARAAVRTAAQLFRGRQAVVIHAWKSPVQRSLAGTALLEAPVREVAEITGELDEMFAGQADDIAEAGAVLAREHGLAASARAFESASGGWQGLVAVAEAERASLVVVGARGRGALASTLLGSMSSGVVHHAELPVLVSPRSVVRRRSNAARPR